MHQLQIISVLQSFHKVINLHDEERVKHLHSIQQRLDNLDLLLRGPAWVSYWGK